MSKRYCIWCGLDANKEYPGEYYDNGMFAIHFDCFHDVMETADDIKEIQRILKGKNNNNKDVIEFIERMQRFQKRAAGITEIMKQVGIL